MTLLSRWRIPPRLLTVLGIWFVVAVFATLGLGFWLIASTAAEGAVTADAEVARRLSPWIVAVLAALWIPPLLAALVARFRGHHDRRDGSVSAVR